MRTLDYSKKDDDVKRDGNNYPNIQKLMEKIQTVNFTCLRKYFHV